VTNNKPSLKIYIGYLQRIAFQDWTAARILWNLGIMLPSLQLLHESIEKYLKVLWVRDKQFSSREELDRRLKEFGHNFDKIFNSLHPDLQEKLKAVLNKNGIMLYQLEALRYGTQALIGFSDALFKASELFIKEIRKLLNQPVKKNLLEELESAIFIDNPKQQMQIKDVLKQILILKRKTLTKKQRKAYLREFKRVIQRMKKVR